MGKNQKTAQPDKYKSHIGKCDITGLLNQIKLYGYFELSPHDRNGLNGWRASYRLKGCKHGWTNMRFFGLTPHDALTELYEWLLKKISAEWENKPF